MTTPLAPSPSTPNQQTASQALAASGIDAAALAPPGGKSKSLYGLGDLAGIEVNIGGLLRSLIGQKVTAEQAVAAFAKADRSDPTNLDHDLVAQIQQKLLYAGFYSDPKYRPRFGVIDPEDIAAFKSAVAVSAQTGSDLNAYLTAKASDGQFQGIAAAIQTAQADVRQIKHANPQDLGAVLQAQFTRTLGRKPTAAEMAGFVAAYDHASTALQQQAYQSIADAKNAASTTTGAVPFALEAAAGVQNPDTVPTPGSAAEFRMADEGVGSSKGMANVDDLVRAIGGQESGGAQNPYGLAANKAGAEGKFQILASNWPSWAAEAGLGPNAPKTPGNQELVARFKLGQYTQKYGIAGAAMAWYGGESAARRYMANPADPQFNKKESGGPSRAEYVQQVMSRLRTSPMNQGPILFSTPPTVGGADAAPVTVDTTDAADPSVVAENYARNQNPGLAGAHDITGQFSNFLGLLSGHFGAGSNL